MKNDEDITLGFEYGLKLYAVMPRTRIGSILKAYMCHVPASNYNKTKGCR